MRSLHVIADFSYVNIPRRYSCPLQAVGLGASRTVILCPPCTLQGQGDLVYLWVIDMAQVFRTFFLLILFHALANFSCFASIGENVKKSRIWYYPGQKKMNHPVDASCDIEESAA